MGVKKFLNYCKRTEKDLENALEHELKSCGREVKRFKGGIYSPGTIPILLCAHLDTVHKELPSEITITEDKIISSPQGIGGDDRCGCYMIMEIIKTHDCHVAFFEQEEVGGEGSTAFTETEICKSLKGNLNYVIELDRKGKTDAVYYDTYNKEFQDFIETEYWKEEFGSFTDICIICEHLDCAGVNLSCGYYNQHTKAEIVCFKEMEQNIEEVKKLIDRSPDKKWDYVEYLPFKGKYNYGWRNYGGYYNYDSYYYNNHYDNYNNYVNHGTKKEEAKCEKTYEIIYEVDEEECSDIYTGHSIYEALGKFFVNQPYLCYYNIVSYAELD